ncbi:thioredoxin fold domain-containing protein [Acetobacter malorum]|nr:thioredoxin fold domain-containing protein [Acetobacter malorum]
MTRHSKAFFAAAILATALSSASSFAAQLSPPHAAPAEPAPPALSQRLVSEDPSKTPDFLKYLITHGMYVTALPPVISGSPGYAVEDKSGRDVIMYLTPDGKSAIVGVMLSVGNGLTAGQPENITALQLASLRARLVAAKKEGATNTLTPALQKALEHPADAITAVPESDPSLAKPFATARKSNDFLSEMNQTKYMSIGYEGKPTVWFVADPQCPFCHRAWGKLSQLVMTGKIAVNVVMVSTLAGSAPIARDILSRPDPGEAWMSGAGSSDDGYHPPEHQASAEALAKADNYLSSNMTFVKKEGLKITPWLGYVGKDGKTVYTHEGADQIEAFLSAL